MTSTTQGGEEVRTGVTSTTQGGEEVRTGVTQYNTGRGGGQDRGDPVQGGEEVRTHNLGPLGGNEARRHLHLAQRQIAVLQIAVRQIAVRRDPQEAALGCGVAAV